ncbi:MAG: tetratricopeptide repeat protein [Candidatus Korobacteraceae bacterium]|jgi:tetratricopeptide (TPR) repeat protein
MTNICRITVLLLMTTPVVAQVTSPTAKGLVAGPNAGTVAITGSSSMRAVSSAREMVTKNPKDANSYTALGFALCHLGQETSDVSLYSEADEALGRALQISPDNFEASKAQVCVLLVRHEFARARELAMILNKRIPDDVMVYGLLVDASAALGNYPEAENAAQWMLNLRPGNTPAFLHAADLREVFGEPEGAIQLLKIVLDATPATDADARVHVLTQMAHVSLEMGNLTSAESMSEQALSLRPEDSRALLVLAEVRLLQGKPSDSVQLLHQSYKALPQTTTLYSLAEAMEAAAMQNEAKSKFAEFERQATSESSDPNNANRELIFYYADHANKPSKALQIGEQEVARRRDVHTLDAYAWALYKNGRYAEAKEQMDISLKVGVREAPIFYHAGEIELRLGNNTRAEHYFREAAELNSTGSQQARAALASVQSQPNNSH